jgi:hypothetical protein
MNQQHTKKNKKKVLLLLLLLGHLKVITCVCRVPVSLYNIYRPPPQIVYSLLLYRTRAYYILLDVSDGRPWIEFGRHMTSAS